MHPECPTMRLLKIDRLRRDFKVRQNVENFISVKCAKFWVKRFETTLSVVHLSMNGTYGKGQIFCAENMNLFDISGNKINKSSPYKGFDSKSYCYLLEHHGLPCSLNILFFLMKNNHK